MSDILVVGGGIVGASIAWHLASAGGCSVRVLERGSRPGEGSTGRATGGYRAQFATEINVRLSLLAREKLLRFPQEVGADPGYVPSGYLWLAERPEVLAQLRAAQAVQHAAGLAEAIEVAPADVRHYHPMLAECELAGAVFCPTDGYIRPLDMLRGYTEAAERLGVEFEYGADVVGLERVGDRITAVRTRQGHRPCGTLVNAAGAWAAALARLADVALPVTPVRRQVAMTVPTRVLSIAHPMTIVADDGFHFRHRDGRALYAWPTPGNPDDPFDYSVERSWVEEAARKAGCWVPALAGVPVDPARCWGGLYELSPDKLAILGRAPGTANFFLANGCSGHGVMHSPAIGQLMAELILDGRTRTLDITPLRPDRFGGGVVEVREIL